jgi:hypothetical protein
LEVSQVTWLLLAYGRRRRWKAAGKVGQIWKGSSVGQGPRRCCWPTAAGGAGKQRGKWGSWFLLHDRGVGKVGQIWKAAGKVGQIWNEELDWGSAAACLGDRRRRRIGCGLRPRPARAALGRAPSLGAPLRLRRIFREG